MLDQHFSNRIHWRRKIAEQPRGGLFYIHGLGESGLCFEKLAQRPELADWNHYAPDLPGFGKSAWMEIPATLADHAAHVRRWIEETCPSRVILVGHSMGGVVSQMVCESHPGLAAGFVNVEGNLSLDDCVFSGQAAELSLGEFLAEGFDRLRDDVYANGLHDPPHRGYYASLRFCDPRQFHANSHELVEMSRREDLAERFADLQLKAKLFVAGLKGGLGARSLELLHEAQAPWIGFEESGHWPFLSQEDSFVAAICDFLNRRTFS